MIFKFRDKTKFLLYDIEDFKLTNLLYYEPATFKFTMNQIKISKIFVDVGANIGGYAIRAAKYCKVYQLSFCQEIIKY